MEHLKSIKRGQSVAQIDSSNASEQIEAVSSSPMNRKKGFMEESGIEHQMSMPDSPQQNGRAKWFQQTILNKAESMRHMAGLSSEFWSYAIRTAIHVYNVTPIAKDGFKTPKKM